MQIQKDGLIINIFIKAPDFHPEMSEMKKSFAKKGEKKKESTLLNTEESRRTTQYFLE